LSVPFARASKNRLTPHDLDRFSGKTVFDRVARALCHAGCLPRKELYESWETARRVRRLFRGGRVVDLAGGHGLLAALMLILDDSSPCAVVVDASLPPSAETVHAALVAEWPRLDGRITFVADGLDTFAIVPSDLVMSVHACGALTDLVLDRAACARARVAVLPCCHTSETGDTGGLGGWLNEALAIDVVRARQLASRGYRIWTQRIPEDITPQNRLLIGEPQGLSDRCRR
jgi:hypothetical protein